jgi:hypothetical protein
MTPGHVRSILARDLGGELTGDQVTFWAECFGSREDVAFGDGTGCTLAEIIFLLANPEIKDPVTPELATRLIQARKENNQAMGCLFVLVLGGISTSLVWLFGYSLWVLAVLGILWLAALVVSALCGHQGFGGHGNTDVQIVVAGALIAAAIITPKFSSQQPCNQARTALRNFADAENEYFSQHKTFTTGISLLNLKPNPQVNIKILRGDNQSFMGASSHGSCNPDKTGRPAVFIWDSAKGGLQ